MADHPALRRAGVNESLAAPRPKPRRATARRPPRVSPSTAGTPRLADIATKRNRTWMSRTGRARGSPILPRLPDSPLGNLKRLARQLQLVHATPPRELLVDRTNTATNGPAPSLRPHYKGLSATTSRSASASRDGTQPLTASAPLGDLPLARPRQRAGQYRDTPSPVPRGSRRPGSRRLHAGHRLASKRTPARLIPESPKHPGFDVV